MSLRTFSVNGRQFRLVEAPDVRRRDIRNRTLTLQDPGDEKVYCFYQAHDVQGRVASLPLSVRIYTTPRQLLEAMLRAAINDAEIVAAFDFRGGEPAADRPAEPMRLSALQRPPDPTTGEDVLCKYHFEGDVLVVRVRAKEFKLAEARRYAELVFDRLRGRIGALVVDLSEVTYMNSSGVSVLARSGAEFRFKIAGISEHVRNVLDVMGLLTVIDVHADVPSAMAALAAKP